MNGIPGFIAQVNGHLRALALTGIDRDLIYYLQEEAENQRVHLISYLDLKNPSQFFRSMIIFSSSFQGFFYFLINIFMPKLGHKIAANLYIQGINTYDKLIKEINQENSPVSHWKTEKAPEISRKYYNLGPNGTLEDMVFSIRKDQEFFIKFNQYLGENFSSGMKGQQVEKIKEFMPIFKPAYPEEFVKEQQLKQQQKNN
ncbi:hypothetical protein PPERSA_00015 [Pseudocohnilembus persalinus]|uniref:Alternative oxidase n=1 Tax=Pseudocohnilembus persalinus TaxID=266149 RepID=A0A0V0QV59_PSEPJ|nr:hypothetical protein PPERSA_00015 [Pseudocohnilembus persalinus]|eukprot:KRX06135.1 hypothetical protein PPERSA_00015 [Pseudocohnilembus persalinus]